MGLLAAGGARRKSCGSDHQELLAPPAAGRRLGFARRAPRGVPHGSDPLCLRQIGMTDKDSAVSRGTGWLKERQKEARWSSAGFGKAEARWACSAWSSVDVMTVSVAGVQDGQHVKGTVAIGVEASDNRRQRREQGRDRRR